MNSSTQNPTKSIKQSSRNEYQPLPPHIILITINFHLVNLNLVSFLLILFDFGANDLDDATHFRFSDIHEWCIAVVIAFRA